MTGQSRPTGVAPDVPAPVGLQDPFVDAQLPGYELGDLIGTGAGAKIYSAVESKTGKIFAVKHVVRRTADDDRFVEQAVNEFNVSHQLDHPSLRHSYKLHRVRQMLTTRELYLVMDYVEGLPLEVARPNRLNSFFVVFRRVAMALDAMHETGFVHADIKPNNIMITAGGGVRIIDFGQACPIFHKKARVQGTPDFIAPEQLRRLPLDQRTDVFNLGATMYWTLTSEKYPTGLPNEADRGMRLNLSERPLAPIELNDKIPLALSTLVMECCRENPGERPADMKLVGARLESMQKRWAQYRASLRAKHPPDDDNAADVAAPTGKGNG